MNNCKQLIRKIVLNYLFDIIEEILVGMNKKTPYKVIENRAQAIEYAILNAKKDDIILLAGKGHEPYQEINGEKLPFDERIIVKEIIG